MNVDRMVDQVVTAPTNQAWKQELRHNIAGLLLIGQRRKENRGHRDEMKMDIGKNVGIINKLCLNPPQECESIATYIKTHIHSLCLFTGISSLPLYEDAVYIGVHQTAHPIPVKDLMLHKSIRGEFILQETSTEKAIDRNDPSCVYMRAKEIAFINNTLHEPQLYFSPDEKKELEATFSTVHKAVFIAVTTLNKQLKKLAPLSEIFLTV
jgi:hypothetical protein